jgi:hypothetical protein
MHTVVTQYDCFQPLIIFYSETFSVSCIVARFDRLRFRLRFCGYLNDAFRCGRMQCTLYLH